MNKKNLMIVGIMSVATLFSMKLCAKATFQIVKNKKPVADIQVESSSTITEIFAARELRLAIAQITGTVLFIRNDFTSAPKPAIILGTPSTSRPILKKIRKAPFKSDWNLIKGSEGFFIRKDANNIYIVGSTPKGVLNGVYSFLEENTDIIWARPNEFGTVFTKKKSITAKKCNYYERPTFKLRGWSTSGYKAFPNYPTLMWMIRNRINFLPVNPNDTVVKRIEKLYHEAGIQLVLGGHNLYYWIPNRVYFKKYPEFYGIVDGIRRPMGADANLCFTNEKLIGELTRKIEQFIQIKKMNVDYIGINQMDTRVKCECPGCVKPIKLPSGKVLTKDAENFSSTQFFIFLNKIAKNIAEKYPKTKLITFSYFLTTPAPGVKLEKNIWILFAPAMRTDKQTLNHKYNKRWKKIISNWTKCTRNLIMREYYGCGAAFCRPLADTVQKDFQYLKSLGFKGGTSEIMADASFWFGSSRATSPYWDVSGMEFWLITKLYWNSNANLEALRNRYLKRTYGPAGESMGKFFGLIKKSWYASDSRENFMASPTSLALKYIRETGIEKQCREALKAAEKKADTYSRKKMIKSLRDCFEGWIKNIKTNKRTQIKVPFNSKNPNDNFNFKSEQWKDAKVIDGFKLIHKGDENSKNKTKVYLYHDKKNLYIACECFDKNIAQISKNNKYKNSKRELFPVNDDRLELFFEKGKTGSYYQMAFGVSGCRYDGEGFNKDWNGNWTFKTKEFKDSWKAIITVPLKTIGVDYGTQKSINALFYREYHPGDKKQKEASSWSGGQVHTTSSFGELILE